MLSEVLSVIATLRGLRQPDEVLTLQDQMVLDLPLAIQE